MAGLGEKSGSWYFLFKLPCNSLSYVKLFGHMDGWLPVHQVYLNSKYMLLKLLLFHKPSQVIKKVSLDLQKPLVIAVLLPPHLVIQLSWTLLLSTGALTILAYVHLVKVSS